jgi:3-phosphoshikimate 1-carboxyvinyltransferase
MRVLHSPGKIERTIKLPASKSICNRLLIIRALCDNAFYISNLSEAGDTQLMLQALSAPGKEIFIRNAGTAMRFLTALFAVSDKEVVLQGDKRMSERPISPLVDGLKQLGADIDYLGKHGYPPLLIRGKDLRGRELTIDSRQSSQFISALLLIAPVIHHGLIINISKNSVSGSYIDMTLNLMKQFGIEWTIEKNRIFIPQMPYSPRNIRVESDWSAASYIYACAALLPESFVVIEDLHEYSLQGDSNLATLMENFGVITTFSKNTAEIKSNGKYNAYFEADMKSTPDLIPTFASLCTSLKVPFRITGISHLKYKESDRALVLSNELSKLGAKIAVMADSISCEGYLDSGNASMTLNTYDDHRMAMSWMLQAIGRNNIWINNPEVVDKSFPAFWEELHQAGFKFELIDN